MSGAFPLGCMFIKDTFKIELDISQQDFISKLLVVTDVRDHLVNDMFPDKKKYFIGKIEYGKFKLMLNRSAFLQNNFKITGVILGQGEKTIVEGTINYMSLLGFVVLYSLFAIGGLTYFLFSQSSIDVKIFFLSLIIIGLTNTTLIIIRINKYKNRFIDKLKTL